MTSIPLYRIPELRCIEADAADQPLMSRAGSAAADLALSLCTEGGAAILILAGPGNNGGDAFEAARILRDREVETCVVFPGKVDELPADAAEAYRRFAEAGGTSRPAIPDEPRWSLIIDGLFGIGLKRAIASPYADLIDRANDLAVRDKCPLLALDCPSGLDADTGARLGTIIRASHTISFIGGKPGLFMADGPDHCGDVSIDWLGIPLEKLENASGRTIDIDLFSRHLQPRPANSHKGCFGNAGILGGAHGMVGAALLAARAALRLGSGRVYAGLLDARAPSLDIAHPELMLRAPEQLIATELTALACGPGMGTSHAAYLFLENALALDIPLVLDADALNLVAAEGELQLALATRASPTLLTPHPTEAARLLDCDTGGIQANRLTAALELAERYNAWIALKGCGTLVATPQGRWFINTTGNPGLATAGSGDVLTGLATALLAQGWPPLEALLAAVHLHGLAADHCVARGIGPIGLCAGELIDSARACFNQWINSISN